MKLFSLAYFTHAKPLKLTFVDGGEKLSSLTIFKKSLKKSANLRAERIKQHSASACME